MALKWFSKKEEIIESVTTKEVDGAVVYIVSWDARWGEYSGNKERVAKAFLNRDDAEQFAESLKAAKDLLQYKEPINVRIQEQK